LPGEDPADFAVPAEPDTPRAALRVPAPAVALPVPAAAAGPASLVPEAAGRRNVPRGAVPTPPAAGGPADSAAPAPGSPRASPKSRRSTPPRSATRRSTP